MTHSDEYFMELAIEQASIAQTKGEVPVGAVFVDNNEVIAASGNAPIALNDPTAHAEIMVIRKAAELKNNYRLGGSVFVTLEPCAMCGGAAALAGVIVLGAREGRFSTKGEKKSMVPFAASSIPLVTLGTFLLWFGWFGFNGFSQLAMGTLDDVNAISKIAVNTHIAGAAGTVTGAAITRLLGGKTDIIMMLNGALAGLVAITAEPLTPSPFNIIIISVLPPNNLVIAAPVTVPAAPAI